MGMVVAIILLMQMAVGLVIGLIARLAIPGSTGITLLLGVLGALAGSFGGQALGFFHVWDAASFTGAALGAVALLAIHYLIKGPGPE